MYSIVRSLIASAVLAASLVQAGEIPPRTGVFKVHTGPIIRGMITSFTTPTTVLIVPVEMEFALMPNLSVHADAMPGLIETRTASLGLLTLGGGARFYLTGRAPDGLWLGAGASIALASAESRSGVGFDLTPEVGYQWIFDNGLTLSAGVGLSLTALTSKQFPIVVLAPVGFAW